MNRAARTTLVLGALALAACGGGGGAKVPSCPTGYSLATDGTCVKTGTTCPTGTHDNGAGVCVPTISCPSGYHDGGSGTCVPTGACSSGYHDGGNGECWIEGTCSSGFHNGGLGACVPLVACSANYHDGGDGMCLRDGTCSPAFHDGGDGRCITLGTCSVGYHDGGGGTCTALLGCLSNYRDDGTGRCVCRPFSSTTSTGAACSCAAGFHDDGEGKCVSAGCATGYHDGGDGTCVWSTVCVTGFSLDAAGLCTRTVVPGTGGMVTGSGGAGGVGTGGASGVGTGGAGAGGVGGSLVGPDAGPGGSGGAPPRPDGGGAGGIRATGGTMATGGRSGAGGAGGTGGTTSTSPCGNGKVDQGELCDCGNDPKNLPSGCAAVNGLFYGDSKGCSKTCTKEPSCLDSSGITQACTTACGDGNLDPGEPCDDGNGLDGDGCSSKCEVEAGFTCTVSTYQDSSTCQSGSGQCLDLPIIYRDFQAENVASGGHPDFPFLGTRYGGSTKSTTLCVPNAGGLAKGNDSTARCVGIAGPTLLNGKPQPGTTTKCDCQFSDWNVGNSSRIQGNYTLAGNDSPLSNGAGDIQGGTAGTAVNSTSTGGAYTGTLTGYTASSPGGPIWKGTVPAYKDAASFKQWFNDDPTVNKTFTAVLELSSIGTNIYQYASKVHLAQGGFFPLDTLNPSQATLCNLWPYYNHGDGTPFWRSCSGDQYLFTPKVMASDCVSGDSMDDGCWVTAVSGVKHDSYFTSEARYYFVYDGTNGIALSFYGDDDLFIFINGVLVLDLGGVHQPLPGKVTVSGSPGDARVLEGGCVDTGGNQIGASAGSTVCSPVNGIKVSAVSPGDFSDRTVKLGLVTGKRYEMVIFGADRHPPESNYQLTLQGFTTRRSICTAN